MKPADFLLGVLDFFAILLPGAIATWLLAQHLRPSWQPYFDLTNGSSEPTLVRWVVFLLAAYTLGHFVFMAGSELDAAYDRWRVRTKPTSLDTTFQAAKGVHETVTPKLHGKQFSTLKWAKSYVQIKSPAARVEIDRIEANSKFFRSLVVVAVAGAVHFVWRADAWAMLGTMVLGGLSFHRFREQRWKLTELSYATAVIIHATGASGSTNGQSKPSSGDGD
jgi:hypothetical protein